MDGLISILQAGLGIGLLIFIHELGHYLAARLAGVRVEVFSLGFGHRLFGFIRNGTDYRLSLFPLGGYVRVAGEDPTQRDGLHDDDLYAKGFGARALFFSGGVFMNLLFALIAFPLIFRSGVEFTAPVIGAVTPGGAAWVAGLEPGDRIASVHGKETYSFENLEVEIALSGGKGEVEIEVERADSSFVALVRPKYSESRGLFELGIEPPNADEPILVDAVLAGSPAARAGLRPRDRIVAIGGERVRSDTADSRLTSLDIGDVVDLVVDRDGAEVPVRFEIETAPSETPRIGVTSATPRIVAVRDTAPVRALGLKVGDVVRQLDTRPFYGPEVEDLRAAQAPVRTEIVLLRDGQSLESAAPLDAAERALLADSLAFGPPEGSVVVVPLDGTPAARAGVLPGDRVATIDGRSITRWSELVDHVRSTGEQPMRFQIERGDTRLDVTVQAERSDIASLGFVGLIERERELYRVEGLGAAIGAGFVASVDLIKQLYVTLKRLFTGDVSARNLGGIVTISRVSYRAARNGAAFFFYFLALLSINLAFINVLPIPVLDGGHLMFLLIERVKGSPVSARVLNYSQILGLVFVIALMVFVTYNDILRLL